MIASAATTLTTTFIIPDLIAQGLASGAYERVGGVVREAGSKKIVAWLREGATNGMPMAGLIPQITMATGIATLGVSVLSLGVSVMGFILLSRQLKQIEKMLEDMQEVLDRINYKIDLEFYSNFLAAIDLATNAFTMDNPQNRRSSALQAINRFLEAEHTYMNLFDRDFEQCGSIIDSYLSTLSLAYISEARCYLELEEPATAIRRFQEGSKALRVRILKYINYVLTDNPAIYLQPEMKDVVSLKRLTKIYRWMNPAIDEDGVFELHRENFVSFVKSPQRCINNIPKSMTLVVRGKHKGKRFTEYLPLYLERAESLIETNQRFEAYELEVKAIAQLGLSFHEWAQLKPTEPAPEGANLMCIVPAEAIAV